MFRVLAGGGPSTIVSTPETMDGPVYGQSLVPLDGVRPVRPTKRSGFRPDVPCETQDVPDLNAPGGPADQSVEARADRPHDRGRRRRDRERAYGQLREFVERSRQGKPAMDPFTWFGEGRRLQAKRLEIKPMRRAIGAHLRDFVAVLGLCVLAIGVGGVHPLAAAAALPAHRGKPEPRLGRAPERPGGHAGAGADGARGRHACGRRGRGEAARGPRASPARPRPGARRPRPPRRNRLLRPRTGLKDMFLALDPGSRSRARRSRGRDDPRGQHAARRELGRDPGDARRRHAGLPQAADRRRGEGSATDARATCARCSAASARSTATWPLSTPRS